MTGRFRPVDWDVSKLSADEWLQIEQAASGAVSGQLGSWPVLQRALGTLGFYSAPGVNTVLMISMAKTAIEYRNEDMELTKLKPS